MKRTRTIFVILVILLCITLPMTVSAEELTTTDSTQESTIQTEETTPQHNPLDEDYQTQLEESLTLNKKLLGIYDTWTSIISIILILVTVFGIAVPVYSNLRIDKKINNATRKIREENEKLMEKNLSINNALMLSASKEYWSSNEILRDILKEDKSNVYVHLLVGRNYFFQYFDENSPTDLNSEQLQDIEDAISHYLFVANHSKLEDKYYTLGVIFPDSIVHELCMLTTKLIEHSLNGQCANYHKIVVSVIRAIEKVLNIKGFDDIANEEQTNVHIMNYINLNHELAKSYAHFGNIKATEQYLYTLKLYSISTDLDYKKEIDSCTKALAELSL